MSHKCFCTAAVVCLGVFATSGMAQRNRITESLRDGRRATLQGHVPRQARADSDRGRAPRDLRMASMSLFFKPSAAQQADLDRFLAAQQDPSSPEYHHWLTPEQYADRFGLSVEDLAKVTDWLASQNLVVTAASRSRNSVSFSGTAQQVESAFGAEIHQYLVNGELHFSNATAPSIPEGLNGVIGAIHGLNDFRVQPRRIARKPVANYTTSRANHYLAPDDISAIYNVRPLYDAGVTGAGQKIVVVGQTQMDVTDIQRFRSDFGLPASDPEITLVPGKRDPGVSQDDVAEANLDIQWAGAIARDATILYVYSYNVMDAARYAIEQNMAPVISISYGLCESNAGPSDAQILRSWAQQANAQGITWIAASGDSGGADCADSATTGGHFDVDLPGAIPEVTSVGGTQFNEGSGTYWNASNTSTRGSAFTYIPEVAWNDGDAVDEPSAGGGGASSIFLKPSWQTGLGVPNDGFRDVPDISMAASAQHDGYLIYTDGQLNAAGGTSVSAPVVAGIAALLNQRLVATGAQSSPGLANWNPRLYSLAQSSPGAFHDILSGSNKVTITCRTPTRTCASGTYGFDAGPGYDQATGLGSLDAYQFVMGWNSATAHVIAPSIAGLTNGASFLPVFAPGMLMSVFGSELSLTTALAATVPFPAELAGVSAKVNGIAAGMYYVSPGQINLQVPDSIPPGSATLTINNNGQTTTANFTVAIAAPGIFSTPVISARAGDIITLYATGTGTALQSLTVTVGGIQAAVTYAGIPPGLAGVVQVNYTIPRGVETGSQPVVVTVSGVASPPAAVTIIP